MSDRLNSGSGRSWMLGARMPLYSFLAAAASLIALAVFGLNHIHEINQEQASIRIDRAARAGTAIFMAHIDEVTVTMAGEDLPQSLTIDPSRLEPDETWDAVVDTISEANQGASNIFRLNAATGSFDRIATSFRTDDGGRAGNTMVEPGLISDGHPAFENLSSGETFIGSVPVAGRLRFAYLTPLVDPTDAVVGILAIDVGFVEDIERLNSEIDGSALTLTVLLIVIILSFSIASLFWVSRPLYRLIQFANELGSSETGSAFSERIDQESTALSNRDDEIGALARSLGSVAELRSQLEYEASHDPLTKIPNRAAFIAEVSRRLTDLENAGGSAVDNNNNESFALMILDLDGFKRINDSLGHLAGDELLVSFAERIRDVLLPNEFFARLGGDEFALLSAPNQDVEHLVDELADRVVSAGTYAVKTRAGEARIAITAGIALAPRDSADQQDLMAKADLALYEAKRTLRGTFTVYEPHMSEAFSRQMQLLPELRAAIDSKSLEMAFQPLFDRTGRVCSVEGLARWNNSKFGVVDPSEFIPIAEGSGLIPALGEWALDHACQMITEWSEMANTVPTIAINISAIHLNEPNFVPFLVRLFEHYPAARGKIKIEVTESVLLSDESPSHRSVLAQLSEIGVLVSIDDFGTGYSSRSYLHQLHIDEIKIDRSFVAAGANDPDHLQLLQGIAALGKGLGLQVVLEGIETRPEFELIASVDCDILQGFGLARPMRADGVVNLFDSVHPEFSSPTGSPASSAPLQPLQAASSYQSA